MREALGYYSLLTHSLPDALVLCWWGVYYYTYPTYPVLCSAGVCVLCGMQYPTLSLSYSLFMQSTY